MKSIFPPLLTIHSTIILDDFGFSLVVRTIWCLGHGYTKTYTSTFEILDLVQHEKEGIRLALTLGTLQHILDYLVALSILYIIILYKLQGNDHGLDV
jgi:hypothetical protein